MGSYGAAADLYDVLYEGTKDYDAEAESLADLIAELSPDATRILDVACGTGQHARCLTDRGFHVDGLDLEPRFVHAASERCPEGRFRVADMTDFDFGEEYDVVLSLFSAIGYARTSRQLTRTLARMAAHARPGGLVFVEPWFEPDQMSDRWVAMLTGQSEGLKVCRMSLTLIEERESRLEFEYLIGRPEGLERRHETHILGLFTQLEMEDAFEAEGLSVTLRRGSLRERGLYVGRKAAGPDHHGAGS